MMTSIIKKDIKDLTRKELSEWLASQNVPNYRCNQLFEWVYARQTDTFEQMSDISKHLRTVLSEYFEIRRLEPVRQEISRDGTRKYLFRLIDGCCIETVLIPEKDHYTLCISSQVGCAQGCKFCLTAKGGFIRNLTSGEIIAQLRDILIYVNPLKPITNIVFMGMGEPLANYKSVIGALETIMNADHGLGFSKRRITISTAGLINRFQDLGRDTRVNLAISLNATDNATRTMLMPINKTYPLEKLLAACANYPLTRRQRITFEYVLIAGINDTEADAKRLVKLLRPIRSKINLIPYNPHEGSAFECPEEATVLKFQDILISHQYTVMVRQSKGRDISAACGQLRARNETHQIIT